MTRTVLVPSSLVRESRDKREATRKLGYVARAATIFRVDRLVVYPDRDGERRWGGGFVRTVLAYAATPPYLRKDAWGRRDELEYVGVLPPLRAVTETGSGSDDSGSLRQGIVTEVGPDGRVRVNCGMQHPISLNVPPEMVVEEGERVTIRVSSREPLRARIVDAPVPGVSVREAELATALSWPDAGVRIAASRHGEPLSVARLGELAPRVRDGFTATFGAPERGLPEILGVTPESVSAPTGDDASDDATATPRSDEPTDGFDLWLNTVPHQGSEVIRTEEALFATLSPLNLE
ncbi:RNA methyltransferase [Halomarina litorea]|uniref:RNA methyltransferase n=1 Tax=Halomarina litorea TaxID=2961595 RepID=UPI0020C517B1|nr:RNA methyltransferase [Halomarina sp. BCD28]